MSEYRLKFKYNDQIVLDVVTNELRSDVSIPSGGWSDERSFFDYSANPEEPVENKTWVNAYAGTPSAATDNFTRLSTQLDINNDYIVDEQQGVRLKVETFHSGDSHAFRIRSLEKFCGLNASDQEVWTELWNAGMSYIDVNWNSAANEEGYLACYLGYVEDKYGTAIVESVGLQLGVMYTGTYTGVSNTVFWQTNVFVPIYDYNSRYQPTTGNVTIGGSGDGSYPSDPAERPDITSLNNWFSFGSSNGKGLTYYSTLIADVYEVFSKIYGNSYINLETRLKAIIDCFRVPFVTTCTSSPLTHIPVADVDILVTNGMFPITSRFYEADFGVFSLENYGWDDYNDFRNTRASLYLPFHGRVNIDINAIARGTIEVVAVCDIYTGNITYWVYTTSMQAPREVLYGVYEGQSAVQIPVANTYNGNLMGKILGVGGSAATLITGLAMENPVTAVSGGIALANSLAALPTESVDKSHMLDSASSATSPLHIRLDIERKEMLRTGLYREYAGIPAFTTQRFGDMTGFIKVHSADYDGLKCAQAEKEIIKQMLEEGVYV